MFTDAELAVYKRCLEALRQELTGLKQTGDEAAGIVELDQTSVGRLSRMDALQGQAMSQERGRRREIELRGIAAALQRIELGDYGYCVSCDEPIARKRLDFDPAATQCIACAEKVERDRR
ncbi:MAG: TraR/DksA family transcriptional regulator [Halobacteria archaeon]|nr:TraR/DksA family transcriptional regulator [Halobacteria archaeon]